MQISGAAVVAEALPLVKHICLVRLCQGFDGRKSLHPAREIGLYGFCPRLLEHDLGHPDMIGVSGLCLPPGQLSFVLIKPGQQDTRPFGICQCFLLPDPFLTSHRIKTAQKSSFLRTVYFISSNS